MAHSHYHRLRKPGTLEDLRVKLWRAVDAAEQMVERAMETPGETERVARALHAAAAVYREYRTLLVDSELEARLEAIEDAMNRQATSLAMRN